MEKDAGLRAALAKLTRIEDDLKTREFFDKVDRINAVTDWERLDSESDELTSEKAGRLFSTILFCDRHGLSLPDWARAALRHPRETVVAMTKHPGTRGGRHTNPIVRNAERQRTRYVAAAVKLASLEGQRGDTKIKAAIEMLKDVGYGGCDFETARRAQGKPVSDFYVLNIKKMLLRGETFR